MLNSDTQNQRPVLTQEQIANSTTTVEFSSIQNPINTECPIRLETFRQNDMVTQIRHCGHIFESTELINWFRTNTRCPVCRYDLLDEYRERRNNTTVIQNTNGIQNTNAIPNTPVTTDRTDISDTSDTTEPSVETTQTSSEITNTIPNPNMNSLFNFVSYLVNDENYIHDSSYNFIFRSEPR